MGDYNKVDNILDQMLGLNKPKTSGKLSYGSQEALRKYTQDLIDAGIKSAEKVHQYEQILIKEDAKEREKRIKEVDKKIWEANATTAQKVAKQMGENFSKALGQGLLKTFSSIDDYIKKYTQYMGTISTRLQGTDLTYSRITGNVARNLGTSPYLKQTDMIDNLNKFVESGIAYNLESRAYIATATQKIATTFNAFDSSLLRLIRIQQADSTVARLGMESLLTKFLNARYQDTSYLTGGNSGNITSQLLEAESLMGYKGASEFDYAVQKWLGSMSSLGVSSNTINMLAQGLGYLGSGNISALSGNTALQNLFVMATGGNFSQYLTGGLNATSASNILQSIVNFGKNIASSGNNVVRSELASLFGLSVSDLISLTNITTQDVKEITKDLVSYEKLRKETTNQLATMGQRTTLSEKVSNVMANAMASLGANVANNPGLYAMWELATMMANSGLDYDFNIGFLGTGTSTKLSTIIKTGVVGGGLMGSLANALVNIVGGNALGTQLGVWGERQTRGTGLATRGVTSGITTSSSSYLGSFDETSTQSSFKEQQEQAATYTGEQEEDEMTKIIRDSIDVNIQNIYNILDKWDDKFDLMFRGY